MNSTQQDLIDLPPTETQTSSIIHQHHECHCDTQHLVCIQRKFYPKKGLVF